MAKSRRPRFAIVPASVLALRDPHALSVYAALALHADDAGRCFPTVETIRAAAGGSKPTVIRALNRLRAAGLVVSEPRWSRGAVTANAYRLPAHPPATRDEPTGQRRLPVDPATGQRGLPAPVNGIDRHRSTPLTLTKPNEEKAKEPKGGTPPQSPPGRDEPAADFLAFWNAYPAGHGTQAEAWRSWRRLAPDAATVESIRVGLAAWKASDRWRRGYVVNAGKFLRERIWEQTPPDAAVPSARPGGRSTRERVSAAADRFAELEKRQP
jgi:Helix-turn-helix domain